MTDMCLKAELRSRLLKLDELDNMMCDIVGTVQQLEFDVLAIDIVPDDPLILEAKISNMQVYSQLSALCSSINFATFFKLYINVFVFIRRWLMIWAWPIDSDFFITDLLEKFLILKSGRLNGS